MAAEISRTTGEGFKVYCEIHGRKLACTILTRDAMGLPDLVFPIAGALIRPKARPARIGVSGVPPCWHGVAHFGRRNARLVFNVRNPHNPI